MKRLAAVIVWLFIGQAVLAGTNSPCVVAMTDSRYVAVAIRQQADFVSVPVTITSDQKDPVLRFEDIQQARATIMQKAQDNPRIRIHSGPAALSARPTFRKESFLSLSYEAASLAQAQLQILVPLPKDQADVFACAVEAERFITGIQLRGKAQIVPGQIQLSVDNPEQHRQKLLHLIAQEIKTTKEILGGKAKVTVEGLHAPVMARQVDESSVDLFIPYAITVEMQE